MSKRTGLAATLGIVALIVMGIACSSEVATKPESGTGMAMEQGESGIAATALQTSGSSSGIWVTGQASVTVEPDLVLLTIGVETTAETVAGARAEAAGAMGSILQSVRAQGLEERDVQTQSFNIWPQYEYPEVTSGETRTRQQILVGYTVSNTAIIRIRDVDAVGTIIDGVAEAGGDATRIDGISFSIEDQKPFMDQLRRMRSKTPRPRPSISRDSLAWRSASWSSSAR